MDKILLLINKIMDKVSTFPKDKAIHFVVGTLIYLSLSFVGLILSSIFSVSFLLFSPKIILGVVILLAMLKEAVWDAMLKKGTPDTLDFFATIIPALLIYILVISQ